MASPTMRDVLAALDWVRGEMWRFSSPDFIRAAQGPERVDRLCQRLVQGQNRVAHAPPHVRSVERPKP